MRMSIFCISLMVLIAGVTFLPAQISVAEETNKAALKVTHTQNTSTVPLYEVFEISFQHEQQYANPFFDVAIQVTFQSPGGEMIKVGGFHYGSSRPPVIRMSEERLCPSRIRRMELLVRVHQQPGCEGDRQRLIYLHRGSKAKPRVRPTAPH